MHCAQCTLYTHSNQFSKAWTRIWSLFLVCIMHSHFVAEIQIGFMPIYRNGCYTLHTCNRANIELDGNRSKLLLKIGGTFLCHNLSSICFWNFRFWFRSNVSSCNNVMYSIVKLSFNVIVVQMSTTNLSIESFSFIQRTPYFHFGMSETRPSTLT